MVFFAALEPSEVVLGGALEAVDAGALPAVEAGLGAIGVELVVVRVKKGEKALVVVVGEQERRERPTHPESALYTVRHVLALC